MSKNLFAAAFLISAFALTACSASHESESLSYELSQSINGVECTTGKQEFGTTDAYCNALADEALNKSCAREMRESLFKQKCSGRSFPATKVSYELRESINGGPECTTGKQVFTSEDAYCNALMDDTLNKNCARDSRESLFKQKCPGRNFPASKPSTASGSVSYTPPSVIPPVVRELMAAGIRVEFSPAVGRSPAFAIFLTTLAGSQREILARKHAISVLYIADFVEYRSADRRLQLDVGLSRADLNEYLSLLDLRLALEDKMQVRFEFVLEGSPRPSALSKFNRLRESLLSLESRSQEWQQRSLHRTVRVIQIGGALSKFALEGERTLGIDSAASANLPAFLDRVMPRLETANPVFEWSDAHAVQLGGNLDLLRDPQLVDVLFKQILAAESSLDRLVRAGLSTIELNRSTPEVRYSRGVLELSTSSLGIDRNVQRISELAP